METLCCGVEALVVEPEASLLSGGGSSRSPPMSSWLRFNCTFNRFLPSYNTHGYLRSSIHDKYMISPLP